jgi:hypothetical protein
MAEAGVLEPAISDAELNSWHWLLKGLLAKEQQYPYAHHVTGTLKLTCAFWKQDPKRCRKSQRQCTFKP